MSDSGTALFFLCLLKLNTGVFLSHLGEHSYLIASKLIWYDLDTAKIQGRVNKPLDTLEFFSCVWVPQTLRIPSPLKGWHRVTELRECSPWRLCPQAVSSLCPTACSLVTHLRKPGHTVLGKTDGDRCYKCKFYYVCPFHFFAWKLFFFWREKKMCSNKLIWGLVLSLFSNFIYKKDMEHTANYWSPGGEGPEVAVNTKLLESKKAERILESTSEDSSLLNASKAWRKANGIHSLLRKSLKIPRSHQARAPHFWISKSDLTFLFCVGSTVNFYCSCIIIHGVPFNSQRCPNVGHTLYGRFKNK